MGPIHIDGPASLPYDVDLGPLVLSDYYYKPADEIAFVGGAPPASDNVLYVQSILQLQCPEKYLQWHHRQYATGPYAEYVANWMTVRL